MMDENLKRRIFLSRGAGLGLGAMAFQLIENRQLSADTQQPSASKLGKIQNVHHPAKAKNVIFLTQSGGPSQIELFDYKSGLEKMGGKRNPRRNSTGAAIDHDDRQSKAAGHARSDFFQKVWRQWSNHWGVASTSCKNCR